MPARRRKSGFRSVPPRAANDRIEQWRAPNKHPVSVDPETGEVPNPPATTWDKDFNLVDSGTWAGGWSHYVDGDKEDYVRINRKIVYEGAETQQEFEEREFLFVPQVPLSESSRVATALSYAANSWRANTQQSPWVERDIEFFLGDTTLTTQGNDNLLTQTSQQLLLFSIQGISSESPLFTREGLPDSVNAYLDAIDETDSVLKSPRPLGDFPALDTEDERDKPWNEREFIAPYGFDDEALKDLPPGVQIVGEGSARGLENYGLVPTSPEFRSLNPSDLNRETQLPVRARRGVGSDYWDWLPPSAKHVFLLRQPYVDFPLFALSSFDTSGTQVPPPKQVFEEWKAEDESAGELPGAFSSAPSEIPANPWWGTNSAPTADEWDACLPTDRRSFEALGTKRALIRIPDQVQGSQVSFVRQSSWMKLVDMQGFSSVDPEPSIEANRRASSLLASGGLWIGAANNALEDPPGIDFLYGLLPGDNFVATNWNDIKSTLRSDEWMLEVGFSAPMPSVDTILWSGGPVLRNGNTLERFLISTSPEGGLPQGAGQIAGEVRPQSGFALSYQFRTVNDGSTEILTLITRGYFAQGEVTKIVNDLVLLPRNLDLGNFAGRICLSVRGGQAKVTFEPYGFKRVDPGDYTQLRTDGSPSETLLAALGAFDGLFSGTGTIDVSDILYDDACLLIPSIRTTRVSPQSFEMPWQRTGDSSSRILTKSEWEAIFKGVGANPDAARNDFQFGHVVGGIAVHDSIISDHNNLENPARRIGGMGWSSWLAPGTPNSLFDLAGEILPVRGGDIFDGLVDLGKLSLVFPWVSLQEGVTSPAPERSSGATFGGSTRGRRKLAEGALCAQWKGTPRWNGVIREPASPDGRPWGFPCGKVVETVSNLKAAPVAELNPVTGSGLPFWSTWGLRFGARRVGSSSFSSTLRSETVPTLSALLDTQLGIGARLTSNWNASVWTTLFSVDDSLPSGERVHNIWKIHNFASLEWVSKAGEIFIRAKAWRYDAPASMEVKVTKEMLGLPLHVNFGAFIFKTPLASGTPGEVDHFGYWLCVDSPDDPSLDKRIGFDSPGFDPNDPASESTFKIVVEKRPANPSNNQVSQSSWVQVGMVPQFNPLEVDYCVGGVELRRWKWDHIKTSGGWSAGSLGVSTSRANLGRSEPFFDSINPLIEPESIIRFPLIREYCKSRSNSLWGYTGRARILPETPSLSSIDGVGVDLFLDRKWSLIGGNGLFLPEAFPSLFLTRQTLAYVPERVAALRLESSDRPQVWECFDRRLARTKFEGANSLCQPPSGKSYFPLNQTTSGALDVFWNLPDRQEAVQFLRRFWIPRGITSPVDPIPEFGVRDTSLELAKETDFTFAIFTPGTDGQGILFNSLSEELGLIQSALSGVVDRFAPSASLRLPTSLDVISSQSQRFSLGGLSLGLQARTYGAIELQRLRNETYPRVREDGSNTLLVPVSFYRQGDKPEIVRAVMQHPDYSDPVPFPTFSLRFRYANNLDEPPNPIASEDPAEIEALKVESNVLGNLCLERQSTLWGFCQTPSDAFPTPFRIVRENLDLEDDQASSFVWRRQRGGRQLLRSPGGAGKAFLGKGRRNWVRALWASVSDENFALDTVPPNPFATNTFALPPLAFEHTEKIPKSVQGNERLTTAWRTKFMSRAIREEISGSPSPFNSGLDGLNPFPTRRTTAVSSGYLGFPVWTPLQSLLAREFAYSLQLGLFPQGELDEIFEGRRKSPWIELTGSQGFALWSEWARIHGLWGKRGVFDSMSPFLAYPLLSLPFPSEPRFQGRALVRKFNEITRLRPVTRSPRAKTDAVNLFEAALDLDEITGTGELLLLDRFTTFDDDYPVVNSGFNFRFVRNIAGRLEADLELKVAGSSPNPGTVNPLALQSGLTRYRPEGKGFLRNTLASQRTSNALLKLWYGTGDNLGAFDYTSWWKTLEFFLLDRGGVTPALIPLSEGTEIEQLGNIGLYEAQVTAGGVFVNPTASSSAGGNFTAWNFPVENRRFVNSVRPYGPNVKGYDWSRSQVWTRDIKLQTRRRIHEHWSLRHSFPQELLENVRITPRGWRYGLSNVTPTGRRWAINPRHWGYLNDLASLPSTAEIGNVDTFPVVVRIPEDSKSRNSTLNFQSFTPWTDWDDLDFKAEVEERAAEPPSLPDPISREGALEFIRTTRIPES